jgi:hypothetical protein
MIKTRLALATVTGLLATLSPAYAQATRTWVSGVGDDVNPCSRTAPCKTFAGAISKTAAGGEISALDPAGFGAVTITKAMTINGTGTLAGILAASSNGIIVNAGVNDVVIIRNVSINGAGSGLDGIRYLGGKELLVEDVTIDGFTGDGIEVNLNTNGGNAHIRRTTITRCVTGIKVAATAPGAAVLALDAVSVDQVTGDAVDLTTGPVFSSIRNSSMTRNAQNGLKVSGSTAQVDVANTVFAFNNVAGVNVTASGTARVADSFFFNNSTGVLNAVGGTTQSNGRNTFAGNSANGNFTGPALTVQ